MAIPSDRRAAVPPQVEARTWLARRPDVPECWFRHVSRVHGVTHTQRVHIHAQRLIDRLGWNDADGELALTAALWHDIGRQGDGVEPEHGARSVARADELRLTDCLAPADAAALRFAILRHSLPDRGAAEQAATLAHSADAARRLAEPERALRVLWLLKDADALDRVRLGLGECADPRQLRHAATVELIPFAGALYAALA
jgi:HD superfamily phosphodiesterase